MNTADSDAASVGLVTPQSATFAEGIDLACGRRLPAIELVYETYGELNAERNNAVLVCHALSGHHHAAGYHSGEDDKPGWWDHCIGPGKPLDTDHFFVVSLNNIGGCHGSTGPASINPETGERYGPDFPPVRVRDWVNSQAMLADHLGIDCWAAVVGGSLGGMQALRWALEYPDRIRHCVVIAAALKLSAQNIAFNEIARQAILSDPDFHDGRYLEQDTHPGRGLSIARMVGHITYLSDDAMAEKFGRDLRLGTLAQGSGERVEFQVESYLRHQGSVFSESFDANTYLLMTKALDYFDLAREYGDDPVCAFEHARCSFMLMSFTSDWRFSPARSQEIVDALIAAGRPVSYANIHAHQGHDAFLLPIPRYRDVFSAYMKRVGERGLMRQDLTHIEQWVRAGSRVLDLACGDGEFLLRLQSGRNVDGLGLEIDADNISTALAAGLNIVEQNLDKGLENFPDNSFDTVVMAHALQAVRYPHLVLDEMLRIGRECIVTFPNFGHWRCRLYLGTRGRMPVSKFMPYTWYDTPNIHFCTVRDFENLCRERGIRILQRDMVGSDGGSHRLARAWPNLFANTAIYQISR